MQERRCIRARTRNDDQTECYEHVRVMVIRRSVSSTYFARRKLSMCSWGSKWRDGEICSDEFSTHAQTHIFARGFIFMCVKQYVLCEYLDHIHLKLIFIVLQLS